MSTDLIIISRRRHRRPAGDRDPLQDAVEGAARRRGADRHRPRRQGRAGAPRRRRDRPDGQPTASAAAASKTFKIVTGGGAFVIPALQKAQYLSLRADSAELEVTGVDKQKIPVGVKGVAIFKVGDDDQSITNAATRFLDEGAGAAGQMHNLVKEVFHGHLRSIIGGLSVEDLIANRNELAQETRDASVQEMQKLGLVVDSLQIQDIIDPSGYIAALGEPRTAEVKMQARIAQAAADREATEREQEAEALKAAAAARHRDQARRLPGRAGARARPDRAGRPARRGRGAQAGRRAGDRGRRPRGPARGEAARDDDPQARRRGGLPAARGGRRPARGARRARRGRQARGRAEGRGRRAARRAARRPRWPSAPREVGQAEAAAAPPRARPRARRSAPPGSPRPRRSPSAPRRSRRSPTR